MNKSNLDIFERHKAQPVGHGYIDIIVSRDNDKDFVADLVNNDYEIDSISGGNGAQMETKMNMDSVAQWMVFGTVNSTRRHRVRKIDGQ